MFKENTANDEDQVSGHHEKLARTQSNTDTDLWTSLFFNKTLLQNKQPHTN